MIKSISRASTWCSAFKKSKHLKNDYVNALLEVRPYCQHSRPSGATQHILPSVKDYYNGVHINLDDISSTITSQEFEQLLEGEL